MEISEIVSYYVYEDTKRLEVVFRLTIDSEDDVRTDIVDLEEAKEFGYTLIEDSYDFFEDSEDEDEFDDDDFTSIDEDSLYSFLNEYYIVYPNKLPKLESF